VYLVIRNEKLLSCLLFSNPFTVKLKINLVFPFALLVVTMLVSILFIPFKLLWFHIVFFIKPHAYRSQKTRVIECKNRHLTKTTQTLLVCDQVPQQFWGDIVLTVSYLINRVSSSILDNPYLLEYSSLHALSISILQTLISYLLNLTNVSF